MPAILSLLIVLALSLLVTRIAAMALMLTGMSRESAKFQARSAFTGVGYTTQEAEDVVAHPVRRRIIMMLMLLGNLGIGAVVATLMLSFMRAAESETWWLRLPVLVAGLVLLSLSANSRYLERRMNRVISWGLQRWGGLHVRDYVAILQLQGDYAISELVVGSGDWLAQKTLSELKLPQEGVLVLGVRRAEGAYLGAPTGDMRIHAGDTVILYGSVERVRELDQRREGKRGYKAHLEAIETHEEDLEEQERIEQQLTPGDAGADKAG